MEFLNQNSLHFIGSNVYAYSVSHLEVKTLF